MFVDVENFEMAGHGDHMIWGTLLCRRSKKWQNKNCNYWKEALQRTNLWLKKQKISSMLCAKATCTVSLFHRLHVVIHCCCSCYFVTICEICTICLVSSHATGKEKTMVQEHSMAKSTIDFKSFTWFVPCGPRDVALTRCRFR